jgi:hypothetical protein
MQQTQEEKLFARIFSGGKCRKIKFFMFEERCYGSLYRRDDSSEMIMSFGGFEDFSNMKIFMG